MDIGPINRGVLGVQECQGEGGKGLYTGEVLRGVIPKGALKVEARI